jgi:hypothetical protein
MIQKIFIYKSLNDLMFLIIFNLSDKRGFKNRSDY